MLEMSQYEADKVIALLQFCCWKSHVEMNNAGLRKLRDQLVFFSDEANSDVPEKDRKKVKDPNEKYLVDLLSESNSASKRDNLIQKSKPHMNLLLAFGGFENWDRWETYFHNASEFISLENVDLSSFSALEIGICFPSQLEKIVLPHLGFVRKNSAYPIQLLPLNNESIEDQLNYPVELLKEYPFVIWVLPVEWNNQLTISESAVWKKMVESQRLLPVWIDESSSAWDITLSRIPWLKNHQTIGGLRGLLCGLIYINELVKKIHHPNSNRQKENSDHHSTPQIHTLHNNKGVVLLGNIHTKNTAMGDITIHNYKNTKKDGTDK